MNGEKREKVGAPATAGRLRGRQVIETRRVVDPGNLSFAIEGRFRYHTEQVLLRALATSEWPGGRTSVDGKGPAGTPVSAGLQVAASLVFDGLGKRLTLETKRKVERSA